MAVGPEASNACRKGTGAAMFLHNRNLLTQAGLPSHLAQRAAMLLREKSVQEQREKKEAKPRQQK